MRTIIPLCAHCLRDKDQCKHREGILDKTKLIKEKGTLTHHCPIYYELIPVGTKVEVELKEIQGDEFTLSDGSPDFSHKWVSLGWVKGTIERKSPLKGFFTIKLDKPVELNIPHKGESWQQATPELYDRRAKRAKDIKII
jgi:hypothetical protein